MKPIIVVTQEDGKILLTKEELEKIINDSYNEGLKDGCKFKPYAIPYRDETDWSKVTCENIYINDSNKPQPTVKFDVISELKENSKQVADIVASELNKAQKHQH